MTEKKIKKVTVSSVAIGKLFAGFILFLALLAGVVYSLTYLISNNFRGAQNSLPTTENESNLEEAVLSSTHPFENFEFHRQGFADIVPSEADVYIESYDVGYLLDIMLTEDWPRIILEEGGLEISEDGLQIFSPIYALFQREESYVLILSIQDPAAVSQLVESVSDDSSYRPYILDNYLIVTAQPNLLDEMEQARSRQKLPLSLFSDFQSNISQLPGSGQFFIYSPLRSKKSEFLSLERSLGLLPRDVNGQGFVILKEAESSKLVYRNNL